MGNSMPPILTGSKSDAMAFLLLMKGGTTIGAGSGIPAAAERADQIHGRPGSFGIELNGHPLLLQDAAVGVDDVEVADRTFPILDLRQTGGAACRFHRLV